MSENNSERLKQLEAEVGNIVHRLTALEEQVHRLARTVDQLRSDYAEEPGTLEKA
jgi:chromosome segregation ATPase